MLRDLQQLPQAIRAYLQSLEPRHYVVPDDKLEMFLEEAKRYRTRRVREGEDFNQHTDERPDSRTVGGASPEPIYSGAA